MQNAGTDLLSKGAESSSSEVIRPLPQEGLPPASSLPAGGDQRMLKRAGARHRPPELHVGPRIDGGASCPEVVVPASELHPVRPSDLLVPFLLPQLGKEVRITPNIWQIRESRRREAKALTGGHTAESHSEQTPDFPSAAKALCLIPHVPRCRQNLPGLAR